MHLILIRHGRPDTTAGRNDPPLTEQAQAQAEQLGAFLREEGIDRIVSSPMLRAQETARPAGALCGLPIEVFADLAEADRDGGSYVPIEELRSDSEAWRRFLDDPIGFCGGDPVAFTRGVEAAIVQLLKGIGGRVEGDGRGRRAVPTGIGKTAVFTHGIPINIVLVRALGLKRLTHFVPHYCSLTRVSGTTLDDLTVVSVNETAHLKNSAAWHAKANRS